MSPNISFAIPESRLAEHPRTIATHSKATQHQWQRIYPSADIYDIADIIRT
jgi:hypothetical protein